MSANGRALCTRVLRLGQCRVHNRQSGRGPRGHRRHPPRQSGSVPLLHLNTVAKIRSDRGMKSELEER
jgi:hypothetical protein